MKFLVIILSVVTCTWGQFNPYYFPNRTTMVFLMDWKYKDIAAECENFLGPKGFGGVQVSSPSENAIINDPPRPWWERYQIVSYNISSRSGDQNAFVDMTTRCNAVGVRIYADVDLNNMGAYANMVGTAGSKADGPSKSYPAIPYDSSNFHPSCPVYTYREAFIVRDCQLPAGPDLDQSQDYIKIQTVAYMNTLIGLGVAGFRIVFAKYMWPSDLRAIYDMLENLNTDYGFAPNCTPYIYHEVIDFGGDPVDKWEYAPIGAVTDYYYSQYLSQYFRGKRSLSELATWGESNGMWNFLPSEISVVFLDQENNERDDFYFGLGQVLNYKNGKPYVMAIAFELAHPFGNPRIMSDFEWTTDDQGPPMDADENIISPTFNDDGSCGTGWICQHRWHQIWAMVIFRNVVSDAPFSNFWSNGVNQIAFARLERGFIAFNLDEVDMDVILQTTLPSGLYCDIITGYTIKGTCTGNTIEVGDDGTAEFIIPANDPNGVIAINVKQIADAASER